MHSSSSTRIGDQVGLCVLKRGNDNFSGDSGEVVKKLFQRVTTFDVVVNNLPLAACHRGAVSQPR